jgi:hypothetical protein
MKALVLLALAALAALPLSARDWREPRRVVFEAPRCAPHPRWEADHRHVRWDGCWKRRDWHQRHGWDDRDDRTFLRPLPRPLGPPFGGRVELRFH